MSKPPPKPLDIRHPAQGPAPAVLVVHSWWGLTSAFVAIGEALAQKGFVVGLAHLFDGRTASDSEEAKRLRSARRREPMYKSLIRNIHELQGFTGVSKAEIGVVGFSMGGHWAVWLSQQPDLPISATVLYYAARAGDFSSSHSSFLAHYAEEDAWVSRASRRRMESEIAKAERSYQAFDYPGTRHWFAENDREREYAPDASKLAFARTVKHLQDVIGQG